MSDATAKALDEFRGTLCTPNRLLAQIVSRIHCGAFDEEFRLLANAEVTNSAFISFPWADLFKPTLTPGEKVAGFSFPSLRKECIAWFESTTSRPSGVNTPSAIGDEDVAITTTISQGSDLEVEQKRNSVVAKLGELLRKKTTITAIPSGSLDSPPLLTKLLADAKLFSESENDTVPSSTSAVGEKTPGAKMTSTTSDVKEGTLYLASADLFLGHWLTHTPGERFLIVLFPVTKIT